MPKRSVVTGPGLAKLEALKKKQFPPQGKAERVAKALAALQQQEPIQLPAEDWKWVVENCRFEDQY